MKKLDLNKIIGYFINRNDRFIAIKTERDWKAIIICFWIVWVVVFGASGYVFWKFQTIILFENKIDIKKEEQIFILKRALLNSALEDLDEKEKRFNENLINPPQIQDPSV